MILIVDSEKVADIKIKHSFQSLGLESVEVVKTAKAAETFIKENNQISMIVINGELADGDGYKYKYKYKLCQELRKDIGESTYI